MREPLWEVAEELGRGDLDLLAIGEDHAEQQARVEFVASGVANVALTPRRPARGVDERHDALRFDTPRCEVIRWNMTGCGELACAIECDPAHHFRLREVLRTAP